MNSTTYLRQTLTINATQTKQLIFSGICTDFDSFLPSSYKIDMINTIYMFLDWLILNSLSLRIG